MVPGIGTNMEDYGMMTEMTMDIGNGSDWDWKRA